MELAAKRKKRKWWLRLITVVATLVHPALGLVVGIAIEAITNKKLLGTDINPTDAQILQARLIIERYVIPVLNNITAKIVALKGSIPQSTIIDALNDSLLKISVLQAYVKHSKLNIHKPVNYMVGATIESLLAKMNMLVTDAINRTGLQKNIETQNVTIIASNYPKLGLLDLDWNGKTVTQIFQKLIYVQHSTSDTVIIPSTDNPLLSTEVQTVTPQTTQNPILSGEKSKGTSKLWLGLGLLLGYKILTSKSKGTGLAGSSSVCTNRVKCTGINKRTGRIKKNYRFRKNGDVIKKNKGLTKNLKLKKGFRYAKGGRIVKAKSNKGLKAAAPLEVTI